MAAAVLESISVPGVRFSSIAASSPRAAARSPASAAVGGRGLGFASEFSGLRIIRRRERVASAVGPASRRVGLRRGSVVCEAKVEPTEKSVEIMRKFSEQYARRSGTYFCVDKGVTSVVIKGLADHKDSVGAPLCPCRHYDDKVAEVGQGFWNCPCVPMRERKECHCMLFLTPDNDFAGADQDWTISSHPAEGEGLGSINVMLYRYDSILLLPTIPGSKKHFRIIYESDELKVHLQSEYAMKVFVGLTWERVIISKLLLIRPVAISSPTN